MALPSISNRQPASLSTRRSPTDIQAYYRDPAVVRAYIERRTAQPLNGLLHRRQVGFLNDILRERRPARVLEVAPGPARLTAELDLAGHGVAIDGSAEMLEIARERLAGRDWLVVRGDAFSLPVADQSIDLAFAIRFVRRFPEATRWKLYAEIRRTLRKGGGLVIDAQNRAVSQPHRARKGMERYPVYDALYSLDELVDEVEAAGFRVRQIEGMIGHFGLQSKLNRLRRYGLAPVARWLIAGLEHVPSREPSTWMLVAEVAK
jgi:SAM-dependent methyltransferase